MGKILVVAEKPSVGRDIGRVLGCREKGDGCVFSDRYVVSWAIGHLVTLCEPEDYDEGYKKWRMEALPIMPETLKTKVYPKTKPQYNILKKLMNAPEVDSIICATDSGREGELIFRYIYSQSGCRKPFDRLWISSMTDAAIKEGFASLKPGAEYDNLYQSAKCRSEADWLVGINASRAYTLRYNALLSVGRVQTPTLAIIVAKQREIDSFVPVDYFEVTAKLSAKNTDFKGKWFDLASGETRIMDKNRAEAILNITKAPPPFGTVLSVETEEKRQPPPQLYDLTELQRDANRKFGYTAQKTLDIAQELYEKRKLITYPRTDSRYLSHDIVPKFKKILTKLSGSDVFNPWAAKLSGLDKLPVSGRFVNDAKVTDHHAIIPTDTGTLSMEALTTGETAVFSLVAKRFMAVFMPNYVYDSTKVVTDIHGEPFLSKGTVVKEEGWMELYRGDKDMKKTDEDDNPGLPDLTAGGSVDVKGVSMEQKKTKPPSPYTEASLLSAMENAGKFVEDEELKERLKESGLGTAATRASIIERLIKVGYVHRKGKSLIPDEKGIKLIDAVPAELKTPETTGKWEKGLSAVAAGAMAAERFMGSIQRYVNYIIQEAKTNSPDILFPEEKKSSKKRAAKTPKEPLGTCPKCGKPIYENSKAYYCQGWKEGCKFNIWKESTAYNGVVLNEENIKKLLSKETIDINAIKLKLDNTTGEIKVLSSL